MEDLRKKLEWDIGVVLRGLTGHPSRRKKGMDETMAGVVASQIVDQLIGSGWTVGRREHGLAVWLDGGRRLSPPLHSAPGSNPE